MSENKLIDYIVEKKKEAIVKAINDSIDYHRATFIERGKEFLHKKLETPEGDLDRYIADVLESEEFYDYVFFGKSKKKTVVVAKDQVLDRVKEEIRQSIENVFYYVNRPMFTDKTEFFKSDIKSLITASSEQGKLNIIDVMIKRNLLHPIDEEAVYVVNKDALKSYMEDM